MGHVALIWKPPWPLMRPIAKIPHPNPDADTPAPPLHTHTHNMPMNRVDCIAPVACNPSAFCHMLACLQKLQGSFEG